MIKDSTIVFVTLYGALLLLVTGMYIKYRIEVVKMRASDGQHAKEWKLVHKLMGAQGDFGTRLSERRSIRAIEPIMVDHSSEESGSVTSYNSIFENDPTTRLPTTTQYMEGN